MTALPADPVATLAPDPAAPPTADAITTPPALPAAPIVLAEGLYPEPEMPEAAYHDDPVPVGSLSQSLARYLLPPYTPEHFQYRRANPKRPSHSQELGTAAHVRTLGSGPRVEVYPDDKVTDWTRKDPQAFRKKVREAGGVPLLQWEADAVEAMHRKIEAHPMASYLLTPDAGLPEASFFWIDDATGVWRRGRTDFLRGLTVQGGGYHFIGDTLYVVDYKTTGKTADARLFARSAWDFYYFIQNPWYVDGIQVVCNLDVAPTFVWVVQETEPPFSVNTFFLNTRDEDWGRRCARAAIDKYAACTDADAWPGYGDEPQEIELPTYARYQLRDWEDARVFDPPPRGDDVEMSGIMPGMYDDPYKIGW